MLKRAIYISNPFHLSLKFEQICLAPKDGDNEERTLPIEDIGFIILEHPHITLTQGVIDFLASKNVCVVFCNNKYLPTSMLFHLDTNTTQTEKFSAQINVSEPLKKQLWQQTVKQKIANQSKLLELQGKDNASLEYLKKQVRSGDPDNIEGRAAGHYWKRLFGKPFKRDRYGNFPNNLLNYGYIVLRAATARAISGSGLLPTLGIHHKNRYNSYCLADDILEPYRPFIDYLVLEMVDQEPDNIELTKERKGKLILSTSMDTLINKKKRPLMVALSETTASLAKCFLGESKKIIYPTLPWSSTAS